jgi:hypothetical protein
VFACLSGLGENGEVGEARKSINTKNHNAWLATAFTALFTLLRASGVREMPFGAAPLAELGVI